jgi:tRNA nucleotidyltransferase (CCA-adding enzyme)
VPDVHDRFGTCTVERGGFVYHIAQARTETYARPGALPDVRPATLEQDLVRRDFTVNALALALGGTEAGSLRAAAGALEDLDKRRLRVFHDRSFLDDPTRLLRLTRYASRLGFEIEPDTLELARAAAASGAFATVSGSRIGSELRLLAREPDRVAAFELLAALGFDIAIEPGFGLAHAGLARRALALLPPDGRADLVVLAVACAGVARERLFEFLDSLAFEAGDREAIIAGVRDGPPLDARLRTAHTPSAIALAVGTGRPELVAIAGALGSAEQARMWLERLRHVRLEIGGRDLQAAGVPQGPLIGEALRGALAAKLDGRASGAGEELAEALRIVGCSG